VPLLRPSRREPCWRSAAAAAAGWIGLDRSLPALRYAQARDPAVTFVQADGVRLPFQSASIDVVFNIEAMNFFPRPAFIAEVSRVLAPGGHFVTAESFPWTPETVRSEFGGLADGHGLALASFRDITGNVHESCIADEGRRRRLIGRMPFYYRPFAREFACLPDSPRFQQFAARSRCYFIAVMTRLGAAAP
jgi:SAM-dependent methyltransferase